MTKDWEGWSKPLELEELPAVIKGSKFLYVIHMEGVPKKQIPAAYQLLTESLNDFTGKYPKASFRMNTIPVRKKTDTALEIYIDGVEEERRKDERRRWDKAIDEFEEEEAKTP